jgi:hypothetical protein
VYYALTPFDFNFAKDDYISSSDPYPLIITLAPALANALAIPNPIPDTDPVIRADLPTKLIFILK